MPSQKKKSGWIKAQMEKDDRLSSLQKKDSNLQDRIHDMRIQILHREQKGNSLRRKIASRRRRLVCRSGVSRKVFKGINALKEQRQMVKNLNRMLEFRLNKTRTKASTSSMLNNTLRSTIDIKRINQTRKRTDCVKMNQELRQIQAKLAELLLNADRVAEEGFVLREKIENIATKNDHELHRFHSDMHQLKKYILKSKEAMAIMENESNTQDMEDDEDMRERMGYEKMLKGRKDNNSSSNSQSSTNSSGTSQIYKKINAEKAFRIMQKKMGLQNIAEVVAGFVEVEMENFQIYKEVMSVKLENQRIEKSLRDAQKEMDKYKEQEAADNANRIEKVNEIKNRKASILKSVETRCASIKSQSELILKFCDTTQRVLCKFIESPLRFQNSSILAPMSKFRNEVLSKTRKRPTHGDQQHITTLTVLRQIVDPHHHDHHVRHEIDETEEKEENATNENLSETEKYVLNDRNIAKAVVLVRESVEELLTTIVKTCRTMGLKVRKDAAKVPPPNSERRAPLRAEDYSVVAPTIDLESDGNQENTSAKRKIKIPNSFYSSNGQMNQRNGMHVENEDLPARPLTAKELMDDIRKNAERKKKMDASNRRNLQDESKMFESTHSITSSVSSTSSSMKSTRGFAPSGPKLAQVYTMLPMRGGVVRSATDRRGKRPNSNTRRETLHTTHHTRRVTTAATRTPLRMKIKTSIPKRKVSPY